MQATKDNEFKDFNTFSVFENLLPNNQNVLLKSAMIYGPNASGKSNILKGLFFMQNAIRLSAAPSLGVISRNETFAFAKDWGNKESFYEVDFIEKNTFYRYNFTIKNGLIIEENLFRRNERLSFLYKRGKDNIEIAGIDQKTLNLIKIPSSSLFVSTAENFQLPVEVQKGISDTFHWFNQLMIVFQETVNMFRIYEEKDKKYLTQAMEILRMADIGIKDFSVVQEQILSMEDIISAKPRNIPLGLQEAQIEQGPQGVGKIDLKTIFGVYDSKGDQVDTKEIYLLRDSGFNSDGTKRLLFYLGWILAALDEGRVIFIDEIDSKLHLPLADYIIKSFNSIVKNSKNAQLIGTAHNLMLMDGDVRRDQIYFTSKDKMGVSELNSLSDFKNVRKTDLFSKKYLLGFYSKLPNMNEDF
ncbi:MAG TPA: hypothetical protein DD618_00850 [Acholeplasmatales bacterium]|nr:hypothetical protein [Acholeplasmatales bacterium]